MGKHKTVLAAGPSRPNEMWESIVRRSRLPKQLGEDLTTSLGILMLACIEALLRHVRHSHPCEAWQRPSSVLER